MTATAVASPVAVTVAPDQRGSNLLTSSVLVARRALLTFMRTPQLLIVSSVTSVMFLLIFRYVFGGAIQTGDVKYVDFLIPALAAVGGLFSTGAVGVAGSVTRLS